jgi:acetyltransferase
MVSFGNACDLESIDFLEYLAVDPKTKVIGAYLENVNDGERFLKIAQEITATKPFVVWKGGRTQAGARVAASHTGALAASDIIWNSVLRQVNAVKVEDIDEMSDYILAFQDLPELLRGDIALITGLADGGGGDSVVSTDICTALGLQIPALLDKTVEGLKSIEGIVTNILSNPVDLNLGAADKEVVWKAMDLITNDPNVAIIIVQEHMASVLTYRTREAAQEMNEIFLEFARRRDKPIILVLKPGLAESMRAETEETFRQAGIPVFPSLMRAAKAVAALIRFYSSHKARHG